MMRPFLHWLLSRGVVLLGSAALAGAIATHGVARAGGSVAAMLIGIGGVLAVKRARRALFSTDEPQPLGHRRGVVLSAADAIALLGLAWAVPRLDVLGLSTFHAVYPGAPIVKAFAIAMVVHTEPRVRRAGNPDRAAEFFHPVMVMFVALAAWMIVDRIVPSGWGPQQAAFATLIAGVAVAFVATVYAIADRLPPRRSEAAATHSGPARPHA